MVKYQCTVCGYVYDSELGDPDGCIQPRARLLKRYPMTGSVPFVVLPRRTSRNWKKDSNAIEETRRDFDESWTEGAYRIFWLSGLAKQIPGDARVYPAYRGAKEY